MASKKRKMTAVTARPQFLASVVFVSLLAVIMIQVWEIRFSPRSSTIATVIELTGSNSSASLLNTTVRVVDHFEASTVTEQDRERVQAVCGAGFEGLVDSQEPNQPILQKSVMVLHISDEGVVCLEEGELRNFGAVDIRARDVGRIVAEEDIVHEISIRESEPWVFIAVAMITFLLTLFVGAAFSVWLDRSYRQAEAVGIETDVRQDMADEEAKDKT
jgi:hypothetical protein